MLATCLMKCPNLPATTLLSRATFTSLPAHSAPRFMPDHLILPLLDAAQRHHHHPIDLRALHAHTVTSGLIRDPFAASRVVQFLINVPSLGYADAVFASIAQPDVYTWNAMIAGRIAHCPPASAVSVYFTMRARAAPPNAYTFALLVKACTDAAGCNHRGLGGEVHGQVLKCGVVELLVVKNSLLKMYCSMGLLREARALFEGSWNLDLISWNTLISAYGKNGDVETARELFDRMPSKSLVSWSAMIDGYVGNGDYGEALRVFGELQGEGMKPDVVTLVSVLKACAHLGALEQGRWIHLYIERNDLGREGNVVLQTALVDLYSKCGCIDEAMQVFDRVRGGDVVLWNAMISGFAMHGHVERALGLFDRMRESGVAPDGTTFIGVLCACAHAGMVKSGIEIFESMRDSGIEPQREHYGCMADILGRAGRLQEAENVLLRMPMEPHASQWGALMSACRTHNDIEVGERVGKQLISLEPEDGGRYVSLANMYAAAGRWEDVRGTRKEMEAKGLRKETGGSFIEWNGAVHEFVAGSMDHPQSREIYATLDDMERKLDVVGYVRDTSQLLVDVDDEEEKRMAMSYHSEKLALAFGVLNISHTMPIRIVKNLRVCRDCHTHAKLVSKVYQREIIVRDRNRFHRFKDGSCSCKDYW